MAIKDVIHRINEVRTPKTGFNQAVEKVSLNTPPNSEVHTDFTETVNPDGSAHRKFTQNVTPTARLTVEGTVTQIESLTTTPYEIVTPKLLTDPRSGQTVQAVQVEKGVRQTRQTERRVSQKITAVAPQGQEIAIKPENGFGDFFIGSFQGLITHRTNQAPQLPPAHQENEE